MDILTRQYGNLGPENDDDEEGQEEGGGTVVVSLDSPTDDSHSRKSQTDRSIAESDDDEDEEVKYRILAPPKSAAPTVSAAIMASAPQDAMSAPVHPSQRKLSHNPTADQLWAPLIGPAHPHNRDGRALGLRNHLLGSVQDAVVDSFMFDEQFHTFQAFGYSVDPAGQTGGEIVGDHGVAGSTKAATVYNMTQSEARKRKMEEEKQEREARESAKKELRERKKKKREQAKDEAGEEEEGEREARGEEGAEEAGGEVTKKAVEGEEEEEEEEEEEKEAVDEEAVTNPATSDWLLKNSRSPWAGKPEDVPAELTEEQKKYAEEHAAKKQKKEKGEREEVEAKSTFHGKAATDYQGRSWVLPPKEAETAPTPDHCYIPKRWIHSWSGHTKGVSAIRFFPRFGHLLLSASMDTKIKIWDVPNSKKCMRTYMGHSKAVRDISFNNSGSRFLSASYDRNIKLWDTETGQVISTFSTGKIPYVVRLNPDEDKQDTLLAGMSDKKIMQWDMRTGEITQEYNEHLGAVNTITFIDDNRRFVTSSDDKSLRVWEFGIPVQIKYICEPHMHSMPSITVHPNKTSVACQSLDNQILIYTSKDKFRLNRKKRFAGHIIAGYACQVNFSPDGRFIMSGDGEGRCWFWDWKTGKVFRTLKCHDSVCIGVEWHPLETSKVATCGWDGLIKYWD